MSAAVTNTNLATNVAASATDRRRLDGRGKRPFQPRLRENSEDAVNLQRDKPAASSEFSHSLCRRWKCAASGTKRSLSTSLLTSISRHVGLMFSGTRKSAFARRTSGGLAPLFPLSKAPTLKLKVFGFDQLIAPKSLRQPVREQIEKRRTKLVMMPDHIKR